MGSRVIVSEAGRDALIPYITTLVANCEPDQRERLLGFPIGHLFTNEATGDANHLQRLKMAKLMRRFLKRMIFDIITGDRRRAALFDPVTLEPIFSPERRSPAA